MSPVAADELPLEPGRLKRNATRSDAARLAPKDRWCPEFRGVIKNYPRSAEAFEARRERGRLHFSRLRAAGYTLTRKGIPDGWGKRGAELKRVRARAERKAEKSLQACLRNGTAPDDQDAQKALQVALEIAFDRSIRTPLRLQAISLVLTFTRPKPTQQIVVETSEAEKWLLAINALGDAV